MTPVYLGIDPGLTGALALLWGDSCVIKDMPTLTRSNGRRTVDLHMLHRLLLRWSVTLDVALVVIENVGAMPGQAFMFQFGFACGAAQMAIVANDMPMHLVTPQVWKKHYGLRGGSDHKDDSRLLASRLFPKYAGEWARKEDDGRAEALLLANYGRKIHGA